MEKFIPKNSVKTSFFKDIETLSKLNLKDYGGNEYQKKLIIAILDRFLGITEYE
jgi:hypothetical protein